MTTRITDFNRNQLQMNQIRRQRVQLAQLENQLSTQSKTDSFAEMPKTAAELLSVQALSVRTNQYVQDIDRLDTRLKLVDEALSGVRKVASNFRTALATTASSGGTLNIADQAESYLNAMMPYLNARDGNEYLFSGSRLTTASVTSLGAAKVPSSTLGLRGVLPSATPINTDSAAEPTAGSYVDVRMSQAIYDSLGVEYSMSLRYIKTGTNAWEARITSLTRATDGASIVYNGKTISTANSVRVGSSFNADTTLNVAGLTFDPNSPPATIGGGNTVFAGSMMPSGSGGARLEINLQGTVGGSPLTRSTVAASAADSQVNASPTHLLSINANLPDGAAVGSSISHTKAVFDSLGRKYNVDVRLTKVADAGNPSLEARNLTLLNLRNIQDMIGRGTYIPGAPPHAWAFDPPPAGAGYLDMAGNITPRFDADFPPGGSVVSDPIYRIEVMSVRDTIGGAPIAGFPQTLGGIHVSKGGLGVLAPTLLPGGGTLGPIEIRQGTITRELSGGAIRSIDHLPLSPGAGPQLVQITGNFSSAAPDNNSIANPTPGSYIDVTFKDNNALIDSSLKSHTLTVRFVKEGVDRWQAYAIGLTQASDNKSSTDPAILPTQPVKMGVAFDPANATVLSFTPALKSGAALNVQIPLPAGSFATAPQAQSNTIDLTGVWAAGDRLRVTVNGTQYTAAGTSAADMAANMRATLTAALGADFDIVGAGTSITIAKTIPEQAGVPFSLGYDILNTGASTLGVRLTAYRPNVPGAARAQEDRLTVGAGAGPGVAFSATVNGQTVGYTTVGAETDAQIRDGLLAALQRNSNITNSVTPIAVGANGIRFVAVTPGVSFTASATGPGATVANVTTNRAFVQLLSRPENTTPPSSRTPTAAIHLSGNLSSGAADNAAYDVRLSGNNALIDSNGNPYNATIRFTKIAASPVDRFEARIVEMTHASGPEIGQFIALPPGGLTFGSEVDPTTIVTFSPSDAQNRTLRLVASDLTIPGKGILSLSLPYNSNSFTSHDGPTRIAPQGQSESEQLVENSWSSSLGNKISDATYALRGNRAMSSHQAQLSIRIADDLTIPYGVRSDNAGFEKLIRVLNFFKGKSAPPSAADSVAGQALLDEALAAIDEMRANLAIDQIALADQRKTHQTTLTMAKNQEAELAHADQTETGVSLKAVETTLELSYKALATLNDISLLRYLG